ncbi:MAG: hypothetical protein IJ279_05715 [Clostridia bacterium]|nr:hypothetical protein [Clostridia bacterium]
MKKFLSILLALVMFISMVPTVLATDNSVTVNFSVFDGSVIMPNEKITAYDGIAEEYGYEVASADHNGNPVNGVTIFDVIVAAHKKLYGDAFTPETAENYLVMTYSFMTKSFGKDTASAGFFLNNRMPNDGIYNESWGSYTGLACDTAVVKDDDTVTYFFYQDLSSWADYKAEFKENEFNVKTGEEITLSVTAFSSWYGNSTEETLAANSVKAAGADIFCSDGNGGFKKVATLDANGEAKISFEEAGEYSLYVAGTIAEGPVVIDWAKVTVEKAEEPETPETPEEPDEPQELTFWQKVVNFFKNIFDKVVACFVWVYNSVISLF